jgi:hypothetical protein
MPKFGVHSERTVSEWRKSTSPFLLIAAASLLIAAYYSRDNIAALLVWVAFILTLIFATTLSTYRIAIHWDASHICKYSIWGKILETINFHELQTILITQTRYEDDIAYNLTIERKTGSPIALYSYESKIQAQHDAELLAALLRLRAVDIVIKYTALPKKSY